MFVARSDALALALVPALLAFAGGAGAAGALNLPASEFGHTSACDACCACTHYLSSTPRRASLCRWGSCHKSGDTSDGRFCWDTVWDPAYTAKSARWGSPCSSEAGWPHACWNARCSEPPAAASGGAQKHASAFAPFGSFTKCAAGEHKPFYGALGTAGYRDCHALCASGCGPLVTCRAPSRAACTSVVA